jgi:hypothetical protein
MKVLSWIHRLQHQLRVERLGSFASGWLIEWYIPFRSLRRCGLALSTIDWVAGWLGPCRDSTTLHNNKAPF